MKRLLMLMLLVAAGYSQGPTFTDNQPNGLWWMRLNHNDKIEVIAGSEAGANEALIELGILTNCKIPDNTYRDRAAAAAKTPADLIKEIDAFYNDGKNISLPLMNALLHSEMKLAGEPQGKIEAIDAAAAGKQ